MLTTYQFQINDRVTLRDKKYIIAERYYPNGYGDTLKPPAYTIYPPGKKGSYGHYCWAYQTDLKSR